MEVLKYEEMPFSYRKTDFIKVVDIIKNRIFRGDIKPGDKIQTETYLSVEFNVSKMAAKKALAILITEGFIYSIPGKGNFVCEKVFEPYALYFDDMMSDGRKYDEIKIISIDVVKANSEICRQLEVPVMRNVIVMNRVYSNEKKIMVFEEKYTPYWRGLPIVESITEYMIYPEKAANKTMIQPATKKLNIKARLAKGRISKLLDLTEGEAILVVEQKKFDEKGRPIEWSLLYFSEDEDSGLKAMTSFI